MIPTPNGDASLSDLLEYEYLRGAFVHYFPFSKIEKNTNFNGGGADEPTKYRKALNVAFNLLEPHERTKITQNQPWEDEERSAAFQHVEDKYLFMMAMFNKDKKVSSRMCLKYKGVSNKVSTGAAKDKFPAFDIFQRYRDTDPTYHLKSHEPCLLQAIEEYKQTYHLSTRARKRKRS